MTCLYVYYLSIEADKLECIVELYETSKAKFPESNTNLKKWRNSNRKVNKYIRGKHEYLCEYLAKQKKMNLLLTFKSKYQQRILQPGEKC